jgi:hypothetical protein
VVSTWVAAAKRTKSCQNLGAGQRCGTVPRRRGRSMGPCPCASHCHTPRRARASVRAEDSRPRGSLPDGVGRVWSAACETWRGGDLQGSVCLARLVRCWMGLHRSGHPLRKQPRAKTGQHGAHNSAGVDHNTGSCKSSRGHAQATASTPHLRWQEARGVRCAHVLELSGAGPARAASARTPSSIPRSTWCRIVVYPIAASRGASPVGTCGRTLAWRYFWRRDVRRTPGNNRSHKWPAHGTKAWMPDIVPRASLARQRPHHRAAQGVCIHLGERGAVGQAAR